jgi:hypothetical protein
VGGQGMQGLCACVGHFVRVSAVVGVPLRVCVGHVVCVCQEKHAREAALTAAQALVSSAHEIASAAQDKAAAEAKVWGAAFFARAAHPVRNAPRQAPLSWVCRCVRFSPAGLCACWCAHRV